MENAMAGEIEAAFNTAWADGPSTSPTEPSKPVIRELVGKTIQSQFDALKAIANGKWVSFATKAAMDANLNYNADTEARVYTGVGVGVYKKLGASGSGSWSFIGPLPETDTTALQAQVDGLGAITAELGQETSDAAAVAELVPVQRYAKDTVAYEMPRDDIIVDNNILGPNPCEKWAKGLSVAELSAKPFAVRFWLTNVDKFASMKIEIWSRSGEFAGETTWVAPGEGIHAADDVKLFEAEYDIKDIADTPKNGDIAQAVRFPISTIPMRPGTIYFAVISAKDGAGNPANIGVMQSRAIIPGVDPVWSIGHYWHATGDFWVQSPTNMISMGLFEERVVDAQLVTSSQTTVYAPGGHKRFQNVVVGSAYLVDLPAIELDQQPNPIKVAQTQVGIAKPAEGTATSEAAVLKYNVAVELGHQYVDSLVIKRASDNVTLVEGTDYKVNKELGTITGLVNTADINVLASYGWAYHRYDQIVYYPNTGQVLVANGPERIRDPNQYLAGTQAYRPLFNVHVTRWGVELIPVYDWDGVVRFGHEAEHQRWRSYCRKRLPKTFLKLLRGDPITIAGYGDSITAIGYGTPYDAPNGSRDMLEGGWLARYPSDTVAAIPKFNGDLGTAKHIHIGWGWRLKARFEEWYGSTVTFDNWGVPGTTSGTGTAGSAPNGGNPTRLDAIVADAPDLVLIAFGANELKSNGLDFETTYPQHVALINALVAAGSEVLLITPTRPNKLSGYVTDDFWQHTGKQIIRAALARDVAYVDFSRMCGPGSEGGIGISPDTMCDSDLLVHPGPYELARYGDMICEIFTV